MRRAGLALALTLLACSLPAAAQPVGRVPTVGYVGLPHEPTEPRWQDGFVRGLRELGYVPGQTIVLDARTYTSGDQLRQGPADFESAFRSAARGGAGAVALQDDPLLRSTGIHVAELALSHRLPLSAGVFEVAESGGLMAYGPDRIDLYRRAAGCVDRILKGAKAGDPPFEQATKFGLVLNLRTAKALGVAVPQSFLLRVGRVIE